MRHILILSFLLCFSNRVYAQLPSISSFTPLSGPVGTLITINGQNLDNGSAKILDKATVPVSSGAFKMVVMVMTGSNTGNITVNNGKGTATSATKFTLTPTPYPAVQQGSKLLGTGSTGKASQGGAVTISSDGNTAAVGGIGDNNYFGAVWIFTRANGQWSQQGEKIIPGNGKLTSNNQLIFGNSVALSADGNTLIIGGLEDSQNGDGVGAAWIYTRKNGIWTEQAKLIGTGNSGSSLQGQDVALSADGNTAVVCGIGDNYFKGALWVFTRSGNTWTQQGQKLVPGGIPNVVQYGGGTFHSCIALSADGNTILTSAQLNPAVSPECAGIFFTRTNGVWTEQSGRLRAGSLQGRSVALSADGNTAMVGGPLDDGQKGGAWIFVKNNGTWTKQGSKLIGPGADSESLQGTTLALSADGNTAIMGEYGVGLHYRGGIWVFTRKNGMWSLQGNQLVGYDTEQYSLSGSTVAISADGKTSINGGFETNEFEGGAWIFSTAPVAPPLATTLPATQLSFSAATLNGTVADNGSDTDVSFEYATDPDLKDAIMAPLTTGVSPLSAGTGSTNFSGTLTTLKPTTTYYFRINATNAGGTSNGDILSFTTPDQPLNNGHESESRGIPNTFTPNDDGINDTWAIPQIENDQDASVLVFNRYGTMLYQSKGYYTPWNGQYAGKRLPSGVYYYIISQKKSGKKFSGNVTLIY